MNSPGQDSSELNDPNDNNTPPDSHGNDSRRRKPAANGRGVNTLSKEALDKKRDNDRKAQAAIRRRQKEEVASLKAQIASLNSQQPYLELKSVLDEKDAIREKYDKLREALAGFVDNIKPLIGPGFQDLAAVAHHNAQAARASSTSPDSIARHVAGDLGAYQNASSFLGSHNDFDNRSPALPHRGPVLKSQRNLVQRQHQLNKDESLDFGFLFQGSDAAKRNEASPLRRQSASVASTHEPNPPWSVLPLISPPDTPLDLLLTDFIRAHQLPTTSPRSVSYPTNPSILNLLNPLDSTTSSSSASPDISRHMRDSINSTSVSPDPLSNYMTKLVSWFDGLTGLPEKVAVCYIMYGVLRWQTYPTEENYYLMPEWMRPWPSQVTVYHPAWFDHLPFPDMRERMIRGQHDHYRFSKLWFEAFTETLSVNWPFSEMTCLASTGKDGQEEISTAFLEHISRLESWTIGSRFFNNFPELRGTAPIRDKTRDGMVPQMTNGHVSQDGRDLDMDGIHAPGPSAYSSGRRRQGNNTGRHDSGG